MEKRKVKPEEIVELFKKEGKDIAAKHT